jgi:hypothetical protein
MLDGEGKRHRAHVRSLGDRTDEEARTPRRVKFSQRRVDNGEGSFKKNEQKKRACVRVPEKLPGPKRQNLTNPPPDPVILKGVSRRLT